MSLEEGIGKELHCESILRRVNLRPSGCSLWWYSVCEGCDLVSTSIELRSVPDSVLFSNYCCLLGIWVNGLREIGFQS